MMFNIPISVYFGLTHEDILFSLLVINIPNLFFMIWEFYHIYKRRKAILKYRGFLNLYVQLPGIAIWNCYKENDIYFDITFINQLQLSSSESMILVAQVVFWVTLIPRFIATIFFFYRII